MKLPQPSRRSTQLHSVSWRQDATRPSTAALAPSRHKLRTQRLVSMTSLSVAVILSSFVVASQADQKTPVTVKRDLVYAEVTGEELKLDLHLPPIAAADKKPPLCVWIHGGGWRGGSRTRPRIVNLTRHGFAVASISYRFSKEAVFPAQIHDCKAAIRWLRANAGRFGYRADWIAVGGGSAGGHLALLLGTSGGVAELAGTVGGNLEYSSRVQAVVDYFGPSDFELRGKTQPNRAYTNQSGSFALLGGKDAAVPLTMERFASPVTYVTPDDPPLLIFHGTADKVVLPDQSEEIAKRYKAAGLNAEVVMVEGAGHGDKAFFQGKNFETALRFLRLHRPDPDATESSSLIKRVLVAAHRGGYANDKRDQAPENSVANLKLAISKGYEVYETDIQRTSDGVFVIMHDATIDRETNGKGVVNQMTLAELKLLKKRYRDGSVSSEPIATLEELLSAGKNHILFKPDLKPGVIDHFPELAALIARLKMNDRVFLRTGFKDADRIAKHFEDGCPGVEIMFKTNNVAQAKAVIDRFRPKTIQVNLARGESIAAEKKEAIRHAIDRGVLVETHVYKDLSQWQQLRELGVRMFHTNVPDQVLEFLQK